VAGASDQIQRDLETFGFEWDGPVCYQSERFEHYQQHLDRLFEQGDCYACECSRRSLREQGVSNGPLGQIYPGNCRRRQLPAIDHSIRLNVERAKTVSFVDRVYGEFTLDLRAAVGDFVLRRADGIFAYHLAVVVDDELQQISEVVRGADLLENTCLHIYLQRCLGFSTPDYMHIPLVNNAEGIKLSKQTGANALDHLNAPRQLLAALRHLGQSPPAELGRLEAGEILQWALDNWHPESIPVQRPAVAESFEF
jgi:glutamyl-Q tRNA(Asp) synthetase